MLINRGDDAMLNSLWMTAFDDSGATAVEYGLIAALVSIAGVAAFTAMGSSLTSIFTYVYDLTTNAT
jgi:pilus assembly protein Flp/PilA